MGRGLGEKSEMEERIEAAFRKRGRGEELTEQEWVLIQYTLGAETCHACGKPGVFVAARGASSTGANGDAR